MARARKMGEMMLDTWHFLRHFFSIFYHTTKEKIWVKGRLLNIYLSMRCVFSKGTKAFITVFAQSTNNMIMNAQLHLNKVNLQWNT